MNHQKDRVSHIRLVHVPLEILSGGLGFQRNLNSADCKTSFVNNCERDFIVNLHSELIDCGKK